MAAFSEGVLIGFLLVGIAGAAWLVYKAVSWMVNQWRAHSARQQARQQARQRD